jgi:hypothetical protein
MYSDQETYDVVNKITDTKSLFSMSGFSIKKSPYKSDRAELFYRLLEGWNKDRVKAGYLPLSKTRLAIAINANPFLKKDDGELLNLIKECEEKGNYKKAQWILFPKKG